MKKAITLLTIALLIALFAGLNSARAASNVTGHRVIIDAGHGGSEPGTTQCAALAEKDATLDIANRLKTLLEAEGAVVYMTRTGDQSLDNAARYDYANSTDGEVLVSVHLNGSTDHSVNGTMALYGKRKKDLAFTRAIQSGLVGSLNLPDLGVTNFASGLLLKSNMPATITESAFLSNTDECVAMTDGTGNRQQEIAQGIYEGLNNWFSEPEQTTKPGPVRPHR